MGVNIKKGIVIKALNNNMVLIKEQGVEKILLAKGLGFNKKFGDILEDNLEVDKVFSIEDKKNQENLKEVYNRVDGEFVAICEEALAEISEELGEELNETIHIGLIDHLAIAMKRLKNKEQINNPFIVEIETLYSVEFEMAKKIVNKLQDKYEIDFPEGEIGFITLHIHSARNGKMLSNSIKSFDNFTSFSGSFIIWSIAFIISTILLLVFLITKKDIIANITKYVIPSKIILFATHQ